MNPAGLAMDLTRPGGGDGPGDADGGPGGPGGPGDGPVGLVVLMAQVAPILAMGLVTETAAWIRRGPSELAAIPEPSADRCSWAGISRSGYSHTATQQWLTSSLAFCGPDPPRTLPL
jgi:hypothetical protein